MSACCTQRPRRSAFALANAIRTSACGSKDDAGWPGKRGSHRPPRVPFRRSHHASRPWLSAGGGSGRVTRPSGRRRATVAMQPMRQHNCHRWPCIAAGLSRLPDACHQCVQWRHSTGLPAEAAAQHSTWIRVSTSSSSACGVVRCSSSTTTTADLGACPGRVVFAFLFWTRVLDVI